jgi:4-diphosphocytidyl-2-C-methyl-D-erythritol kinase
VTVLAFLPEYLKKDSMSASCARATGRGTELVPVVPLKSWIVIAKPRLSVSTKEVYEGIDALEITRRPDNDKLVRMMEEKALAKVKKKKKKAGNVSHIRGSANPDQELCAEFVNVLEDYTLRQYPEVPELKEKMLEKGAKFALMSGSGPTVFGIYNSMTAAKEAAEALRKDGTEAYWTRTVL